MKNVKWNIFPTMKFSLGILCLFLISFSSTLQAEEDIVTDIILINGLAELVDINHDGEVLQRYMAIPDYFSSGRSHKRTLRESLAKTKIYGAISTDEEYFESVVYSAPVECRQSLLKKVKETYQEYNDFVSTTDLSQTISERTSIDLQLSLSAINEIAFYNSKKRKDQLRQRSLIDERFRKVALCFRSTSRTSKAIIEV